MKKCTVSIKDGIETEHWGEYHKDIFANNPQSRFYLVRYKDDGIGFYEVARVEILNHDYYTAYDQI